MAHYEAFVVSGDPEMARWIGRRIASTSQITVVGTAHSGCAAIERIAAAKPDLVLSDLLLDDMLGLHMARRLHARDPRLPVLITCAEWEAAASQLERMLGKEDCTGWIDVELVSPETCLYFLKCSRARSAGVRPMGQKRPGPAPATD